MFVVTLRFSANKTQAPAFMQAHNDWIRSGFDAGTFLLTGSIKPGLGGVVLAAGLGREALEAKVNDDPFVREDIVKAEIIEIAPGRADDRLSFLLG